MNESSKLANKQTLDEGSIPVGEPPSTCDRVNLAALVGVANFVRAKKAGR